MGILGSSANLISVAGPWEHVAFGDIAAINAQMVDQFIAEKHRKSCQWWPVANFPYDVLI